MFFNRYGLRSYLYYVCVCLTLPQVFLRRIRESLTITTSVCPFIPHRPSTTRFRNIASMTSRYTRLARHMAAARPTASLAAASPGRCAYAGTVARRAASSSSPADKVGSTTVVDQTRQGNDASQPPTEAQAQQAQRTNSDAGREHPAQQPDPQPSPSKSTGVEPHGPGADRAGAGPEPPVQRDERVRAHQKKREAVSGKA